MSRNVSSVLLLIFAPFLLAAVLAIKLDDRGPVLYSQERVTRNGRSFRISKLRTMRVDAEAQGAAVWAASKDARITRVGAFLRRTRIDEMPQLFNVLRGDTHPFPTLARTIWDDPQRYLDTYFKRFPGRYHSADAAVMDRDGQIWVLGRSDDVINVAAHRISTMEIESAAAAEPGVAEAAVVGVHDAVRGTVPVAFVTLRPDADADAVRAGVARAVERAIGGIARLDRIVVTTALPKTRAGKVMRRLLREAAETGAIRGDTTGLEDSSALEVVLEAVGPA